jgi:hypothetical protein
MHGRIADVLSDAGEEGKKSIKVAVQPVVPGWDDWLVNSERRMNRVEGRQ